jgi:DNA repair protein RadC
MLRGADASLAVLFEAALHDRARMDGKTAGDGIRDGTRDGTRDRSRSCADHQARCKLAAARELVRRALAESMARGDALASPQAVRDFLRLMLARRDREIFMALYLDAQHRVIGWEELFRGTLTQTSIYPREVIRRALAHNAAAVILAHNHPSGVAEPSPADASLTRTLTQLLALVDTRVLDHVIVAGNALVSFAERGLL